jgi:hypothetical protein
MNLTSRSENGAIKPKLASDWLAHKLQANLLDDNSFDWQWREALWPVYPVTEEVQWNWSCQKSLPIHRQATWWTNHSPRSRRDPDQLRQSRSSDNPLSHVTRWQVMWPTLIRDNPRAGSVFLHVYSIYQSIQPQQLPSFTRRPILYVKVETIGSYRRCMSETISDVCRDCCIFGST